VTYYILFFIHLGSRKIHMAGITPHPTEAWMMQVARKRDHGGVGFSVSRALLIHDRDGKVLPGVSTDH